MTGDLQRRIDAVLTAYRSDGGTTPEGYVEDDKLDTPNGDFAQWCLRNLWVLERHGLYLEHPTATAQRGLPSRCHLQMDPGPVPGRVYFLEAALSSASMPVAPTVWVKPKAATVAAPVTAAVEKASTVPTQQEESQPSDGYNGHIT